MLAGLLAPSVGSAATLLCGTDMADHVEMSCCSPKEDQHQAGTQQLAGTETCSTHAICEVGFSEAAEIHSAVLQTPVAFVAILPGKTEKVKPAPRKASEVPDESLPVTGSRSSIYLLNSTFLN